MSNCYHCCYYMVHLSEKLRMVNSTTKKENLLQDEIDRLIFTLDGHGHASNVAHVLHQDIQGASAVRLIPLLQCVVKSVTKLQGNVLACFENWLPDTVEDVFKNLCEKKDVETISGLMILRIEWNDLFSWETLNELDKRLCSLDENWPIFKPGKIITKPSVPEKVKWILPPLSSFYITSPTRSPFNKPSPIQSPRLLTSIKASPLARIIKPSPTQSPGSLKCNKPSPKVMTISKDSIRRSSLARFQSLEFIKPPSARQLTTQTRLRRLSTDSNSDKENDSMEFYQQFFTQNTGYNLV